MIHTDFCFKCVYYMSVYIRVNIRLRLINDTVCLKGQFNSQIYSLWKEMKDHTKFGNNTKNKFPGCLLNLNRLSSMVGSRCYKTSTKKLDAAKVSSYRQYKAVVLLVEFISIY